MVARMSEVSPEEILALKERLIKARDAARNGEKVDLQAVVNDVRETLGEREGNALNREALGIGMLSALTGISPQEMIEGLSSRGSVEHTFEEIANNLLEGAIKGEESLEVFPFAIDGGMVQSLPTQCPNSYHASGFVITVPTPDRRQSYRSNAKLPDLKLIEIVSIDPHDSEEVFFNTIDTTAARTLASMLNHYADIADAQE